MTFYEALLQFFREVGILQIYSQALGLLVQLCRTSGLSIEVHIPLLAQGAQQLPVIKI